VLALTDSPQAQAALDNAQATWDRLQDDEALRLFEGVLNDFPDTEQAAEAVAMMGLWRWEHQDRQKALAAWNRVLSDYPESLARAEAWHQMASAAEAEEWYGKAATLWRRVIREFPDTSEAQRAARRLAWLRTKMVPEGDYVQAIQAYTSFIEQFPDDPNLPAAEMLLGHNYLWLHETKEALPWYHRIITEHPLSPLVEEALYYRGYCKSGTGDPAGALTDLRQVVDEGSNPELAVRALTIVANCHQDLGQDDEARAALQEILADSSPPFANWHATTMYLMGCSYCAQRRPAEARLWLTRLLAQYPNHISRPAAERVLARITRCGGCE